MKKKINNYRWQKQQQAKREYQKVKKAKEAAKKIPEDATEELDYIKKLLSGEDVGNFGPEEEIETIDDVYGWVVKSNPWFVSSSYTSKMSPSEILEIYSKVKKSL